jgi:tripartite-type tricarboxylate transporter receptor subunit TctC
MTAKKTILTSALLGLCIAWGASPSAAAYPSRTIELVCGWGVGGGTDLFARSIAKPLSEALGTNVVVLSQPGSNGLLAADYVQKQEADGHTVWVMTGTFPLNVALNKSPHPLEKYEAVCRMQYDTYGIHVTRDSPFRTWDDIVAHAKANPGKLTLASSGSASFDELTAISLLEGAGIDVQYVPYDTAGKMHAALLGGHVDLLLDEFGPVIGYLQDGSMRALLAVSEKRVERLPDVPTTLEKGINYTAGQTRGIMVKAGTPPEIVERLAAILDKAQTDPGYHKFVVDSLLDLRPGYLGPKEWMDFLQDQVRNLTETAKKAGF